MLRRDDVPILRADDDLVEALEKIGASDVHRALVLDGDHLVGLLSITDLVRALEVGAPSRRRRTR
jgi:CBS domain-containing protein